MTEQENFKSNRVTLHRSDTESRSDQELAGEEKRKREERGWKEGQRQKI